MGSLRYAKSKGRCAENTVVAFFRAHGFEVERRRLTGCEDCGDLSGITPGVVVEIKDHKKLDLAGFMDELESEIINATARFQEDHTGVAVIKRKGFPANPEDWYAVLPLARLVRLLQKAGYK